ncbi:MarR family transcriptional regulator [Kocuria soli]|uniref:MarR family transcriptional regulator n=1 Tax=Kocuria soli TaxID=2485125 RepID=A0A3N3ZUV3_9MICC|nr:MarR family transcriptional regulator [Kocuria soli]ROZ63777.1 MarR family transcriptional regulator [Kocuria soli]
MSQDAPSSTDPLVQLADAVLHVGRKLRAYPLQDERVAPLTALECLVLLHIDAHPGVAPSALASTLSLTSSNASTALRGLVKKGQVERRPDPSDRRAVCLHLTGEAERSVATVRGMYRDLLSAIGLPAQDVLATVRTLHAIDAAMNDSAEQ